MRFSLRAVGYRPFMSLRIAWRQMIQPTTTSQPIVLEDSNILRDIECCVLFVRYKTLNRLSENIEYSTEHSTASSITHYDLLSVCRSVTGRVALEIGSLDSRTKDGGGKSQIKPKTVNMTCPTVT